MIEIGFLAPSWRGERGSLVKVLRGEADEGNEVRRNVRSDRRAGLDIGCIMYECMYAGGKSVGERKDAVESLRGGERKDSSS